MAGDWSFATPKQLYRNTSQKKFGARCPVPTRQTSFLIATAELKGGCPLVACSLLSRDDETMIADAVRRPTLHDCSNVVAALLLQRCPAPSGTSRPRVRRCYTAPISPPHVGIEEGAPTGKVDALDKRRHYSLHTRRCRAVVCAFAAFIHKLNLAWEVPLGTMLPAVALSLWQMRKSLEV